MTDSPYVLNVTVENFEQVVQSSFQTPVMLDFWAPWCGPRKSLTPILEKLAAEYAGAFVLAKINTDEEQILATQLGIRSLPTVMLIKDGQQLDGFMGAQPEGQIRALLEQHIGAAQAAAPAGDQRLTEAETLLAAGQAEQAVALLQLLSADEPDNHDLQLMLAQALLQTGAIDEVEKILAGLPSEQQDSDQAKAIRARMQFAAQMTDTPELSVLHERLETDPKDIEARYLLAVHLLVAGNHEAALEELFTVMRQDRSFRDDIGRRSLVDAFAIIDDPALIARYRQRMASLLF